MTESSYSKGAHAIGIVDGWTYTKSGYQITTIDGVQYGTLFDLAKLPNLKPGAKVAFVVRGTVPQYGLQRATIERVISAPEARTPHKRSRRRKM